MVLLLHEVEVAPMGIELALSDRKSVSNLMRSQHSEYKHTCGIPDSVSTTFGKSTPICSAKELGQCFLVSEGLSDRLQDVFSELVRGEGLNELGDLRLVLVSEIF